MYQLEALFRKRWAAAGLSLLVGFLGSAVGIVYGWAYAFDRVWFLLWFCASLCAAGLGIREWYTSKVPSTRAVSSPEPAANQIPAALREKRTNEPAPVIRPTNVQRRQSVEPS